MQAAIDSQLFVNSIVIELRQNNEAILDNRVYFIKGKFSASSVIHEFAHPLIKGIAIQNPKLFNSLFNQLTQSPTGLEAIKHVRNKYPELIEKSIKYLQNMKIIQK